MLEERNGSGTAGVGLSLTTSSILCQKDRGFMLEERSGFGNAGVGLSLTTSSILC